MGLDAQCGRCLKRYRHELSQDSFQFASRAHWSREDSPLDPEGRAALERTGICLGEELETGWYRGNELELDRLFGGADLSFVAPPGGLQ